MRNSGNTANTHVYHLPVPMASKHRATSGTASSEEPRARKRARSTAANPPSSGASECPLKQQIALKVLEDPHALWPRDYVLVCSDNTAFHLAKFLCDRILPTIRGREHGGSGVDEHLWTFEYGEKSGKDGRSHVVWKSPDMLDYDDDDDDGGDEECEKFEIHRRIKRGTMMEELKFKAGSMLRFKYDMGTTTTLYLEAVCVLAQLQLASAYPQLMPICQPLSLLNLKVLGPLSAEALAAHTAGFDVGARFVGPDQRAALLATLPASAAPAGERLDDLFPCFSRTVVGRRYTAFVLGMCVCNTPFSSVFAAVRGENTDLLFSPFPFLDLDEFLLQAEKAFQPSVVTARPTIRPSCISRILVPADASAAQQEHITKYFEPDPFGPVMLQFRFRGTDLSRSKRRLGRAFSFATMFPRTHQQLTSGRFRWLSYRGGVLRVCAGRATARLECPLTHVLREWLGPPFASFHELMCAVELSWVHPGVADGPPLGSAALDPIDADMGPLLVPPRVLCPVAAYRRVLRVRHHCDTVTALLIDPAPRSPFAYSGHANGTIRKWNLETGSQVWCIQATRVTDGRDDTDDDDGDDSDEADNGFDPYLNIVGLQLAESRLYSWSASPIIKAFSTSSGKLRYRYDVRACDFTRNVSGVRVSSRHLSVNCVVISSTPQNYHVLFAGLNAYPHHGTNRNLCDNYQSESFEGNIVLFDLVCDPNKIMTTWNGHCYPVTSMAAIDGRYLASLDSDPNMHLAMTLLLWDLGDDVAYESGGVPLRKLVFHTIPRGLRARLAESRSAEVDVVDGIAVHGNTLVLMYNYGHKLALVDLPSLKPRGFIHLSDDDECSFSSSLAACGKLVLPVNCGDGNGHVFDVTKLDPAKLVPWRPQAGLPILKQIFDEDGDSLVTDESESESESDDAATMFEMLDHEDCDSMEENTVFRRHACMARCVIQLPEVERKKKKNILGFTMFEAGLSPSPEPPAATDDAAATGAAAAAAATDDGPDAAASVSSTDSSNWGSEGDYPRLVAMNNRFVVFAAPRSIGVHDVRDGWRAPAADAGMVSQLHLAHRNLPFLALVRRRRDQCIVS